MGFDGSWPFPAEGGSGKEALPPPEVRWRQLI
jgi:hypothetical protein